MKFKDLCNVINEGISSPFEKMTGVKRHVTFEQSEEQPGELGQALKDEMAAVPAYGYGDKSGNKNRQTELDDILKQYLGEGTPDEIILKKAGVHIGTSNEYHVYSVGDDLLDEFKPYNIAAYSAEDVGDSTSLFPLTKFYSVLIGTQGGEVDGIPALKEIFYNGPGEPLPPNK